MRHHQRSEDTVFLGCLGDIGHGSGIALTAIATANDTHTSVLAVLIPGEEVHADKVYTEILVVLEESVDIFLASGILGHGPMKPVILYTGVLNLRLSIIIEVGKGIVGSFNLGLTGTVNPERVVIHAEFQSLGLAFGHQVFQRDGAILGHVARGIGGEHGDETVGADHVIAVGLEVGSHKVDHLVPLVGRNVDGGDTLALLFVAVFIHAPVERCLHVVMDALNDGQFGQLLFGRIFHLHIVLA